MFAMSAASPHSFEGGYRSAALRHPKPGFFAACEVVPLPGPPMGDGASVSVMPELRRGCKFLVRFQLY